MLLGTQTGASENSSRGNLSAQLHVYAQRKVEKHDS